jgi:hypothetical protein
MAISIVQAPAAFLLRCCGDSGEALSCTGEDLVKTLLKSSKRSLSDVAQILMRRWIGHPGEVLSKRDFHDLVQAHMCPGMSLYRFL